MIDFLHPSRAYRQWENSHVVRTGFCPSSLPLEVRRAKKTLADKGWSYRAVAPLLGVHWSHLAKVLTGRRESKRLLAAIAALPPRDQ